MDFKAKFLQAMPSCAVAAACEYAKGTNFILENRAVLTLDVRNERYVCPCFEQFKKNLPEGVRDRVEDCMQLQTLNEVLHLANHVYGTDTE